MRKILKPTAAVLSVLLCLSVSVRSVGALETSAKAHIVINADTLEVLAAANANLRLSMASTTKIMTALILAEQNTPEREITVTDEMVRVEGSSMGLLPGDKVSYYELLVGMLLPSGNDAANAAAISVSGSVGDFAALMNKRADELGMKNTHFVTPSGLDDGEHYSTAYDMAVLAAAALKNDTLKSIVSQKSIRVSFGAPPYERILYNHNKLLDKYEYCIGVKTGYTKKSGRCLVSAAKRDGCTVVAVTLNAPDDWNDHKKLLDFGLKSIKLCDITSSLPSSEIPVVGGVDDTVTVGTSRFLCGVGENTLGSIRTEISVPKFIYAPVSSGQKIGTVNYYYGEHLIRTESITVLSSVPVERYEKPFFASLWERITGILRFLI